jgi:hypothetical protein
MNWRAYRSCSIIFKCCSLHITIVITTLDSQQMLFRIVARIPLCSKNANVTGGTRENPHDLRLHICEPSFPRDPLFEIVPAFPR